MVHGPCHGMEEVHESPWSMESRRQDPGYPGSPKSQKVSAEVEPTAMLSSNDIFRFRRFRPATRKERSLVAAARPDILARRGDPRGVLRYLESAAYVDFGSSSFQESLEDGELELPPELKAGRIAQLSVQYLMHSLRKMQEKNRSLEKVLSKTKSGVEALHARHYQQQQLISNLKRHRKELNKILDSHNRVLQWADPSAAQKVREQHSKEEKAADAQPSSKPARATSE